jgi:hypothetical protein
MFLAEIGLNCAINLCKSNVLLLESCGSLLVLWGKSLAVTAPWGKD